MKIKDLTPGERLFCYRRREGFTQSGMADYLGVTYKAYRNWESDLADPPDTLKAPLRRLETCETVTLLRKRARKGQPEVAEAIGMSTWWLCQQETGKVPVSQELLKFWGLISDC